MESALALVDEYADLGIGIADASVAVLAGRHRTVDLFCVDGPFSAMRPLCGEAFRLLLLEQASR